MNNQFDSLSSLLVQSEAQNKELSDKLFETTKSLVEAEGNFSSAKQQIEDQMESSILSLDKQKIVQDLEEKLRNAQEQLQGVTQTSEVLRQNISDQSDTILDLQS